MKTPYFHAQGSAILITLAFMVLITVLVVGLMETVKTERVSSSTHLEGVRAEFFALKGVDRVVATLQRQTAPQTTGSNNVFNWISQPGQLIVANAESNGKPVSPVALSSGSANSALQDPYSGPNINLPTFRDPSTFLITDRNDDSGQKLKMQLKWVYVRSDGTLSFDDKPSWDSANPIVGRYAYWTDDENSKINYNLAWGRSPDIKNPNPPGNPTSIELTALMPSVSGTEPVFTVNMANALHAAITTDNYQTLTAHGFFNSPGDARQVAVGDSSNIAIVLEAYKFELTHYNSDPDTTFFNEPKILLTTQKNLVRMGPSGQPLPFLDILTKDNSDPGILENIDKSKLDSTINFIISYLQRSDWPMAFGSSFQKKYYNNDPNRLTQLALNIIEYVRCKESSEPIVAPIRGAKAPSVNNGSFVVFDPAAPDAYSPTGATGTNGYIGLTRIPCITELGIEVSTTPSYVSGTLAGYKAWIYMEVFLPNNYGLNSVDLGSFQYNLTLTCGSTFMQPIGPILPNEISVNGQATSTLPAGQYAVIKHDLTTGSNGAYLPFPRPSGNVSVRMAIAPRDPSYSNQKNISTGTFHFVDIVPQAVNSPILLPISSGTSITSVGVDDPRVNKHIGDWKTSVSGSNTFGSPNAIYKSGAAISPSEPEQDADSDGKVSDASLYMPPPKGQSYTLSNGRIDDNRAGVVTSIGELGYINTGMESSAKPGIPWRSLRLQPNKQDSSVVPDWALMDLFTVPVVSSTSMCADATRMFSPNGLTVGGTSYGGTAVGGRVNINSALQPFNSASFRRTMPLAGVIQGCTYSSTTTQTLSPTDAQTIAANIYNHVLAPKKNGAAGKDYNFSNGYYSPGEVGEIAGISDGGEQSEELIRQISNLITARGNVFTVYSIGQSIKQTHSGQMVITGERRVQSMIERYVYDSQKGEVRIRTVYYRNLTP